MSHIRRCLSLKKGNCRNSLPLSRTQRKRLAEELDQQWKELIRHATIERDTEKLLQLAAALAIRKRRASGLTPGQSDLPAG